MLQWMERKAAFAWLSPLIMFQTGATSQPVTPGSAEDAGNELCSREGASKVLKVHRNINRSAVRDSVV